MASPYDLNYPLVEMYRGIGGYVYVANNPINIIDPDGRKIVPRNMTPEQEKQFYDGEKILVKIVFYLRRCTII